MMRAEPAISVVTVTFNSEQFIRGYLESAARGAGGVAMQHVVVDNAPQDATAAIVRAEFPDVVFVQNAVNRGFTAANNKGASLAAGRYVVFLNPDTKVPDGALRTLMEIMDR